MTPLELTTFVHNTCNNPEALLEKHSHVLYLIFRWASSDAVHPLILHVKSALLEIHAQHPKKIKPTLFIAETCLALNEYKEFLVWMKLVAHPSYSSKRINSLLKVRDRLTLPADEKEQKVFGIGLSKTGTTSLDFYLTQIGVHATHFTNLHTRNLISASDLSLFTAFSDITISWQFEQIYALLPKAKFIYTTRQLDTWTTSITQHYQSSNGILKPCQLNESLSTTIYQGRLHTIHDHLYTPFDSWEAAYQAFDQRVADFFQDKDPNQLLKIDLIQDPNAHLKVAEFLGKEPLGMAFPHKNKTE